MVTREQLKRKAVHSTHLIPRQKLRDGTREPFRKKQNMLRARMSVTSKTNTNYEEKNTAFPRTHLYPVAHERASREAARALRHVQRLNKPQGRP